MAKLDDLIQQKQQRDEDWKAKKTAEREELGQLSDDAVMHVTSEPGAYLHYLNTQARSRNREWNFQPSISIPSTYIKIIIYSAQNQFHIHISRFRRNLDIRYESKTIFRSRPFIVNQQIHNILIVEQECGNIFSYSTVS